MGWISPTGASGAEWTDLPKTYDENTNTGAGYSYSATWTSNWTSFLELTHAALNCDKVQFHAYKGVYLDKIDLDVFWAGGWHHIYEGTYSTAWIEKSLGGEYSVTKARIRIHRTNAGAGAQFNEFDFWELPAPPVVGRSYGFIIG